MYANHGIHCIVRWLYAIVAKHLVNRYCSKDCVTQAKTRLPHSITVYARRSVCAEFFTRSKKGDRCRKGEKERCRIYTHTQSLQPAEMYMMIFIRTVFQSRFALAKVLHRHRNQSFTTFWYNKSKFIFTCKSEYFGCFFEQF